MNILQTDTNKIDDTNGEATRPQYCFVVGLPRTGTKLMVNVLEGAPNRACAITPENFFLGRAFLPGARQRMRKFGDLGDDANVEKLVEAMFNGSFHGEFWDRLANGTLGIGREAIRHALLASDRSDRAIYEVILNALAEGKPTGNKVLLLGDKTGPHLYHVPTLLAWFPNAKIVHTFRDPRAILASEHKKRLQQLQNRSSKRQQQGDWLGALAYRAAAPVASLLIVLYITSAWLRAAHLHYRYQRRYPNHYRMSRFEDLVGEPEENVQELCRFLDLQFHADMLNPPRVDSSFERKQETGFDPQTLDRWQDALSPWMKKWLRYSLGGYLRGLGYSA